jgi:predicted metal-dependent hydrolase
MPEMNFNIRRSNRKTMSIYIERDGSVSVLAPQKLNDAEVSEIVRSKEYQIYKGLAKWKELNSVRVIREPVNGQSFLYLGRNYRLAFMQKSQQSIMLKHGLFLVDWNERGKLAELFADFYRQRGMEKIKERVEIYKGKMGLIPKQIRILELKNRWASCSPHTGNLNFHWKTMMAPLSVLDYVIVHEMAHLRHAKHSQAFWNEVDKVMPDYQNRIQWLRENGARLTL